MGNTHSIYRVPGVKVSGVKASGIQDSGISHIEKTLQYNKRTAAKEKERLMCNPTPNMEELVQINYMRDQMELCERLLSGEYKLIQMIKDIMKTDSASKYQQLLSDRTLLLNSYWTRICKWEEISPVPPEVDLSLLELVYDYDVKMRSV